MRLLFITYLIIFCSINANALDYDVDWPISGNGKHVLAITINGCETRFIIKDKDLDAFTKSINDNNSNTSLDLITVARKHTESGCK